MMIAVRFIGYGWVGNGSMSVIPKWGWCDRGICIPLRPTSLCWAGRSKFGCYNQRRVPKKSCIRRVPPLPYPRTHPTSWILWRIVFWTNGGKNTGMHNVGSSNRTGILWISKMRWWVIDRPGITNYWYHKMITNNDNCHPRRYRPPHFPEVVVVPFLRSSRPFVIPHWV